ncbi:hypothetical protein V6Z11_A10G220900 [Gossypium hirsutum]
MEFCLKIGYHLAKDGSSFSMLPVPWESHRLDDWKKDQVLVAGLHVPIRMESFQKCYCWRDVGLLDYDISPNLEKVRHKNCYRLTKHNSNVDIYQKLLIYFQSNGFHPP